MIKNIITNCTIFFLLFHISTHAQINFQQTNWKQIIQTARNENKLIFLFVSTSWCASCKVMKNNVFTDKEVGSYLNENCINYEVDAENTVDGKYVASYFNVTAFPTYFFISAKDTQVLNRYRGAAFTPAEFLMQAKNSVEKKKDETLLAYYKKNLDSLKNNNKELIKYIELIKKYNIMDNTPLNALTLNMNFQKNIPNSYMLFLDKNIQTVEGVSFLVYYNQRDQMDYISANFLGKNPATYTKSRISGIIKLTERYARETNNISLLVEAQRWKKKFEQDYFTP